MPSTTATMDNRRDATSWSGADVIMTRQLEDIASRALEEAVAKGTRWIMNTHLSAWTRFCGTVGVDEETFGPIGIGCEEVTLSQVGREVGILALFAAYIVCYPERKNEEVSHNSVAYAEQVIGSVRSHYATKKGRRPGLYGDGTRRIRLKRVAKGLRKMCSTKRLVRKPILQHHLRAVRRKLDLIGSQTPRIIWALLLTQLQGVLRSGDLIKKEEKKELPCVPGNQTHRRRFLVDMGRDE